MSNTYLKQTEREFPARLKIVSKPRNLSTIAPVYDEAPFKDSAGKYKDIATDENVAKGKYPPIFNSNKVRVYRVGEKGSGITNAGKIQDFQKIRRKCLEKKILFEDPNFPADDSSISLKKKPNKQFKWLRPTEIVQSPKLFVKGVSRFDVQQGDLGDCWVLAGVANLTLHEKLFFQIVPNDQSFDEDYAGVFHFRFWQFDSWLDVVIDDRLPTLNGDLVYLHSSDNNEFWSALLEKAYAKLHGSYKALEAGSSCDSMEDFTGGLAEVFEIRTAPPNLYSILLQGYERCSLMGCSYQAGTLESERALGLVGGHAYSITKVSYVDIKTPGRQGKIPLLRIRNPWGDGTEWTGAWSDRSREWQFISDEEKQRIGITFDRDGEFWMSFKDFSTIFTRLDVCNLEPDSLGPGETSDGGCFKVWETKSFHGEWVRGVTAGGYKNIETFHQNPQYSLVLNDPDDDENLCTVVVALMQKNRRSKKSEGANFFHIGFIIYEQGPDAPKPLTDEYLRYINPVARYPTFINDREVSFRFRLPPGTYCIIPCTFDPNNEGDFLLRVYTIKISAAEEYDDEIGFIDEDESVKIPSDIREDRERSMLKIFTDLNDSKEEMDWSKLKELLHIVFHKEFPNDLCRSMVAMLDSDDSGKLGFDEFQMLINFYAKWMSVFQHFDPERKKIPTSSLKEAYRMGGYILNRRVLNILAMRYATEDDYIELNDFLICAVRLNTMIDSFIGKMNDPVSMSANFTLEEWIRWTMYS